MPMRVALGVVLLAGCFTGPAKPPAQPQATEQQAATPGARAWAPSGSALAATSPLESLIGDPEVEGLRAVARWLEIDEASTRDQIKQRGVEVHFEAGRVDTIFLHLVPEGGRGPVYHGPLFLGLDRAHTRADIERRFGVPTDSGAPTSVFDGHPTPWIKYRRDDAQLHFQFNGEGPLEMITIMNRDWKP